MTKEELDNLIKAYKEGFVTFNEVVGTMEKNADCIYSRQTLIDLVIYHIQHDNIYLARHILDAIDDDFADWYDYDGDMGTLEAPMAVKSIEDIEDLYGYVD